MYICLYLYMYEERKEIDDRQIVIQIDITKYIITIYSDRLYNVTYINSPTNAPKFGVEYF